MGSSIVKGFPEGAAEAPKRAAPARVHRWAAPMGSLVAVALLLPAVAFGAERAWTPSEQISEVGSARNFVAPDLSHTFMPLPASEPKLAIDGEGRALLAWTQYETSSSLVITPRASETYGVMTAQGTAADGWSPPERLAEVPASRYPMDVDPSFNRAGADSLSWGEGTNRWEWSTLFRVERIAGGGWSPPERIEPPWGVETWGMQLWRSPAGGLHAVGQPAPGSVAAARWSATGGWSEPDVLPGEWRRERVLFDHAGNAIAFVRKNADGFQEDVSTATWRPGLGWSAVHELGALHGSPVFAVTGAGEVIVAWEVEVLGVGPGLWTAVRSAVRSPGGVWSQSVEVDPPRQSPGFFFRTLALAGAEDGDAVLVRGGYLVGGLQALRLGATMTATRPANGQWSAMAPALPAMGNVPHDLVVNDRGEAVAVWSTGGIPVSQSGPDAARTDWARVGCRIEAATRSAAGSWSAPHRLAEPMGCADMVNLTRIAVQLNAGGEALVVFPDRDGGTHAVRATSFSFAESAWTAPATLSAPDVHGLAASMALNERGDAVAVWEQTDNGQPYTLASKAAVYGARWAVPPPAPAERDPETGPAPLAAAGAPVAEPTPAKAPAILSAFVAVRPDGQLKHLYARGERTYVVRVTGRGALPRGARVQVARAPSSPGPLRRYARTLVVRSAERPQWARLLDAAGRASAWRWIRLDRGRPIIRSARLVGGRAGVLLRIAARDDVSGVARMQLARTRSRPGALVEFRASHAVSAGRAPRWVRVADGMGKTSAWSPVWPLSESASGPRSLHQDRGR